jgi:hypothetical protein
MDERYRHVRLQDWNGKIVKLLDRLQQVFHVSPSLNPA